MMTARFAFHNAPALLGAFFLATSASLTHAGPLDNKSDYRALRQASEQISKEGTQESWGQFTVTVETSESTSTATVNNVLQESVKSPAYTATFICAHTGNRENGWLAICRDDKDNYSMLFEHSKKIKSILDKKHLSTRWRRDEKSGPRQWLSIKSKPSLSIHPASDKKDDSARKALAVFMEPLTGDQDQYRLYTPQGCSGAVKNATKFIIGADNDTSLQIDVKSLVDSTKKQDKRTEKSNLLFVVNLPLTNAFKQLQNLQNGQKVAE